MESTQEAEQAHKRKKSEQSALDVFHPLRKPPVPSDEPTLKRPYQVQRARSLPRLEELPSNCLRKGKNRTGILPVQNTLGTGATENQEACPRVKIPMPCGPIGQNFFVRNVLVKVEHEEAKYIAARMKPPLNILRCRDSESQIEKYRGSSFIKRAEMLSKRRS